MLWLGCYYYISSPTVEVDRKNEVREFHFPSKGSANYQHIEPKWKSKPYANAEL